MRTPRMDRLDTSFMTPGGEVVDVRLALRLDERGAIVASGPCTAGADPVAVSGKLKIASGRDPTYTLKLRGTSAKLSATIQGTLGAGAGIAAVKFKGPQGKIALAAQPVTLSTSLVTCVLALQPRLDARGRIIGVATVTDGFGGGQPIPGTIAGKISGDTLTLAVKVGREKLAFKGVRTAGASSFLGAIKYTMPPEKGELASSIVDLDLFCVHDMDCDSIADADELDGWDVTVTLADGSHVVRRGISDPHLLDTDGDGLDDAQELMARSDPARADTDADGLDDRSELFVYKSDPGRIDSDGDSRGPDFDQPTDPNLWDGAELQLTRTSPTLADTDGDGWTDWEEIHAGGTNPRIADLPELELRLYTDPELVLNVVATAGEQHILSSLEQKTSEFQRSDTVSNRIAVENTVSIHTEIEAGTSRWPPSASAKMTTDTRFEQSYMNETSSSWTQQSVNDSKNTFNEARERVTQYQNGLIKLGMKIINRSPVAIRIGDPRVIATRFTAGGSFRSVGTLGPGDMVYDAGTKQQNWVPDPGSWEMEMAPGEEVIIEIGDGAIPAQVMEALLRDPTALMFEIGSYSLFSADGTRNYVEVGEDVIARTGVVVIDYGDGMVERYAVATNVYRQPDGSGAGVTLREALSEIAGVEYGTCPEETWDNCDVRVPTGRNVLCSVRGLAAYGDCGAHQRGFWMVGGNGDAFDGETADFDDVVIYNGERVSLVWIEDTDGDGIFDREEYLLGTDELRLDSDMDGLDDFAESRVGWDVAVQEATPYRVYPDPRFVDVDDDSLSDAIEASIGTDPYLADTDADGDPDDLDPNPLVPPCLHGGELLIAAWWDGATAVDGGTRRALDAWRADTQGSDGVLSSDAIAVQQDGNAVFRFVNLQSAADYISVPNDPSLGPTQQYTIAGWVNFGGVGGGETWGLLLSKGHPDTANFAISVAEDGRLRHTMYRRYYTKCEQCSIFGCSDPLCADDSGSDRQEVVTAAGAIPRNQWTHIAVTYVDQVLAIYVDGNLVVTASTIHKWTSGLNHRNRYTTSIVANTAPLMIGGDPAVGTPFGGYRGLADDLQLFHRGFNAGQIRSLYRFGICRE